MTHYVISLYSLLSITYQIST